MARIGINGFGRIGRYLVRLMAERNEFPVVINARADNASLAHLFKYDSVHHTFKGTVGHDENGIIINGTHIAVTRCKPNEWQWKDYGVDLVVESTGTIKKRAGLAEHMACGAKKVIMSAPVSDADITIVMGVNDGLYDPAKHDVVSSASCTTNCLAPVAKVLNDTFGIEHGLMTTIHSYTMSQRILDGSQKDIRRARASKIHPEYDIFVFHGISMLLINGVERSRRDHKNISLPGGILFHSHLYPAAAFFHIDQFHFVMPVKHHGRKVQGNGTGINIKRKKPAAVPLCFLKLFLLI